MNRSTFSWNGYNISFLEKGQGAPIVFLHAFPFNALMWEPQFKELSTTYHLIALDLPGLGQSTPIPETLTMDLGADVAAALLDHCELSSATICGLSMGGYTALAFAEHYPEYLESLVLADTHAAADSPEKKQQRHHLIHQINHQGPASFFKEFIPSIVGTTTKKNHPAIISRIQSLLDMANNNAIVSALQGMAKRPDRFTVLQQLSTPVLILVGEEDMLTPPSDAKRMADASPQAQLEVIPETGHMSNLENPHRFNGAIQTFLAQKEKGKKGT
jgi:pimeloyl-ACP methyl ester carboxylesterase